MFHLKPCYFDMFEATDTLFDFLAENDFIFRKNINNFMISDTIIYLLGVPVSWYYMDKETNQICSKKNYKDISTEKILNNCRSEKMPNLDILAKYMSEESVKTMLNDDKKVDRKIQYVNKEFCKAENLKYYLIYKKKTSGLFQNFVRPLEDKNFIIEVEWKNQIINMNRKINKHSIYDKLEPHKKLATLEYGYENHIVSSNLSNERVTKNLREICGEIKRRINQIYYYKYKTIIMGMEVNKDMMQNISGKNIIKSMTLHFKIDPNFNVYLLYCTNLEFTIENQRFMDNKHVSFGVIFKIPTELTSDKVPLKLAKEMKMNKEAELFGRQLCVGCDKFVEKESVYKMDYKTIIKNHELFFKNETEIPKLIKKINGENLIEKMYFKFKKYANWLESEVNLCDDCYMDNTKFIEVKVPRLSFPQLSKTTMSFYKSQKKTLPFLKNKNFNITETNKLDEEELKEFDKIEKLLTEKARDENFPQLKSKYNSLTDFYPNNKPMNKTFTRLTNPKSPNAKKNNLMLTRDEKFDHKNVPSNNLLTLDSRERRSSSKKRKTITNSNISIMNPISPEDFKNALNKERKSNSTGKKYFGFSEAVIKYYDTENKNLIKSTMDKMVYNDVSRKMSDNKGANPILNLVKISKENQEKIEKNEKNENDNEKLKNSEKKYENIFEEKKKFLSSKDNHTDIYLPRNYLPEYSMNMNSKRPVSAEKAPRENEIINAVQNLLISNYNNKNSNHKRSSNRRKSKLTISIPKNEEMKKIKIDAFRNTSLGFGTGPSSKKNKKEENLDINKDYLTSNNYKEYTTAATERGNKFSQALTTKNTHPANHVNLMNKNSKNQKFFKNHENHLYPIDNYIPNQTDKNFYIINDLQINKNSDEKNLVIFNTYNQEILNENQTVNPKENYSYNKKLKSISEVDVTGTKQYTYNKSTTNPNQNQNNLKKYNTESNKLRSVPIIKKKKLINIFGDEVDEMLSLVNDLKNCSLFSTNSAASNSTNFTKY